MGFDGSRLNTMMKNKMDLGFSDLVYAWVSIVWVGGGAIGCVEGKVQQTESYW